MTDRDFTTAFTVPNSPEEVFAAVTDVRGWWSEDIRGRTDALGEFDYRYQDLHRARIRVTELVPGRKVAWHVVENWFSFTRDQAEWTGTDVVFDIAPVPGGTELRLTHRGLTPDDECFEVCSDGWGTYVNGSLRNLLLTGRGRPNTGAPITGSERVLAG